MTTLTPEPKIYTYENDFKQFVEAIHNKEVCSIDEEMFYYWLEVLPPVYMNKTKEVEIDGVKYVKNCSFGFAEGFENVIDFWTSGGGEYFCKLSNRKNTIG